MERGSIMGKYTRTSPMQVQFWIDKGLTENEAKYKIRTFRKCNVEYWTSRGYSEMEAPQKISEFQMENMEKRKAKVKDDPSHFRRSTIRCKEYWESRGYSEADAMREVEAAQSTFSLEKCIAKHGKEEGTKRWEDRQKKWQTTLMAREDISEINARKDSSSYKYCMSKCDGNEKLAIQLYQDRLNARVVSFGRASRASLNVFLPLYKFVRTLGIDRKDIYFGIDGSKEYWINDGKARYSYDFTVVSLKLIFEFNGNAWHPTKENLKDWKHPHGSCLAQEMFDNDERKQDAAKRRGFEVITLWEHNGFYSNLELAKNEVYNRTIE